MLDLEGDSDVEVIAPCIPHAELPLDAALPERTPTHQDRQPLSMHLSLLLYRILVEGEALC